MPSFEAMAPRTMFPPPITTPSDTPISTTDRISSVSWSTTDGSMPNPRFPASASPDSLSRTLWFRSSSPSELMCSPRLLADGMGPASGRLAHLEPREACHCDLLTRPGRDLGDQLLDGLVRILHEGLRQQRALLEEALQLALDDLLGDGLRLAL